MTDFHDTREDWGKLVLRIAVGGLMLFHGASKVVHGVEPIEAMLTARGLPGALVYGVYVGEVVAPLLILMGLWVRPAGVLLAINMVFAVGLAHTSDVFTITPHGAWALELQAFYLLGGVALALIGGGRYGLLRR